MKPIEKSGGKANRLTRKCYDCAGQMDGRFEDYNYTECGLQRVVLSKVMVFRCKSCGAIVPEIPALSSLHISIMMALLRKKSLLSGEEIRFLRKMTGFSSLELAAVMGIHKTNLSKWETGARTIGKESDRMLRLVCFSSVMQQFVSVDESDLMDRVIEVAKRFSEFDIHTVLKLIENKAEGSKVVRIDPIKFKEIAVPSPKKEKTTVQ